MTLRLFDFAGSPFCIKIRAVLDHKRLRYERIDILSGISYLELRRRNPTRKVPALEIDGRLVIDSTEIAYALDDAHPDPPLRPADPRLAADNHVLEDWADESLYFYGLWCRWQEPEGRRLAPKTFRGPLAPVLGATVGSSARSQLAAQGIGRKPIALVRDELSRSLQSLETRLEGRDYLLGHVPYLCDFALMGQLVYLQRTPMGAALLDRRPAMTSYLDRMRALRTPDR